MAAPSISTYILSNSSHYYGSEGGAAVMTSPSDSVTKVSAIISQTSGGAAIETVDTTVKTSSDLYADRWALTWPTAGITASPYYVRMWATNSDGDGATREVAPYIYFPPSVSVTSPVDGSTLTDSSVTMAWTATDDYGISYQRVSISHDGTELWGAEVEGNSIAVPSSVVFENGESYSFSVMARNGKGMESTATNTASFSFVAPSAPALVIAEGDGKSATITVDDPHYSESGATIAVDGSAIADEFTVFGSSVQDGTPSPSSPVPIESIESPNLFDQSAATAGYLNANGTISGPTANNEMTSDYIPVTAGEDVGVYLVTEVDYAAWICFMCFNADQSVNTVFIRSTANQNYARIDEMPAGAAYVRVSARHLSTGKAQLYVSRGKAYYANPYVGPTELPINANGGNLLKPHARGSVTAGGLTSSVDADGTINISNTASGVADVSVVFDTPILFEAGKSYTVSMTSAGTRTGELTVLLRKDSITYYPSIPIAVGGTSATFTPSTTGTVNFLLLRTTSGNSITLSAKLSIYEGTETTYTEPQGSTTSIDLQGNALRSLPDGTRDELRVGERVTLVKRVGHIADVSARTLSYSGGSIPYAYFPLTAGEKGAPTSGSPARNNCMSTVAPPKVPLADPCCYVTNDGLTVVIGSTAFTSLATATTMLTGAEFDYALATPQEIDLGAASDHPFIPEDGEMWVDGTEMEASLRPADYAGQPMYDSVDVIRVNADGSTWTVASNLTTGDTVTDPLPPLGVDAVYKAVGKTSAGGMSEKLYMHEIPTTGWVLNFGNAAQETVGFIYNPQATMTLSQGGESYHFADGGMGGGLPVFYPTTDRDASGTLAFDTVLYGDSDRLLDLCRRYPVAWLRDPFGHRWRAHVRPSVSHGVGQVWPVTIAWDAVRFEEV